MYEELKVRKGITYLFAQVHTVSKWQSEPPSPGNHISEATVVTTRLHSLCSIPRHKRRFLFCSMTLPLDSGVCLSVINTILLIGQSSHFTATGAWRPQAVCMPPCAVKPWGRESHSTADKLLRPCRILMIPVGLVISLSLPDHPSCLHNHSLWSSLQHEGCEDKWLITDLL